MILSFAAFKRRLKSPFRFEISAVVAICSLFCLTCNNGPDHPNHSTMDSPDTYAFPYRLGSPSQKLKLPKELREISGLAWLEEERLVAVQDENGIIYTIDFKHGEIDSRSTFGPKNDYEGITRHGKTTWVLRSDGRLFEVEEEEVVEHETPLDSRYNVEGLAWDEKGKRLLLACKEFSGEGLDGKRSCFAYDPTSREFPEEPFLTLDLDEILEASASFDKRDTLERTFQPSGMAIHPISGNIYFISSVGKKLAVYTRSGSLLQVTSLKYKHFKQPEGICFAPDGRMYIANEGGGKGRIVRFDPR